VTTEEVTKEDEIVEENGKEAEDLVDKTAPAIKLEIYEGPLYEPEGNICYYIIKVIVTGNPIPDIEFSEDCSDGSLGDNMAQVNLYNPNETYTFTATATNEVGKAADSIMLDWGIYKYIEEINNIEYLYNNGNYIDAYNQANNILNNSEFISMSNQNDVNKIENIRNNSYNNSKDIVGANYKNFNLSTSDTPSWWNKDIYTAFEEYLFTLSVSMCKMGGTNLYCNFYVAAYTGEYPSESDIYLIPHYVDDSCLRAYVELYPTKIVDIAREGATYTINKYGHSIVVSVTSVHETPYTMEGDEVSSLWDNLAVSITIN